MLVQLQRYSLGGQRLDVVTECPALADYFSASYCAMASMDVTGPPFTLKLSCGTLPEPGIGSQLAYDGPVLQDGHCQYFVEGDETLLIQVGKGALWASARNMTAELVVLPGEEAAIRGMLGIAAIEAAAHAGDQAMFHAAALALPDSERVVLIHAPSGMGKTTTALALLAGGYQLASDDAAFLPGSLGNLAWGLPRDLKVHRNSVVMMPWLEPLLLEGWSEEDERRLPYASLAAIGKTASPTPRPVAALFRLARSLDLSCIRPLNRAEALASLAADNVRASRVGLLPVQRHRFNALVRLAAAVPVYELCAGRDIENLPELVASASSGV